MFVTTGLASFASHICTNPSGISMSSDPGSSSVVSLGNSTLLSQCISLPKCMKWYSQIWLRVNSVKYSYAYVKIKYSQLFHATKIKV